MNFELTDEQQLIRDTVREFALMRVAPVYQMLITGVLVIVAVTVDQLARRRTS